MKNTFFDCFKRSKNKQIDIKESKISQEVKKLLQLTVAGEEEAVRKIISKNKDLLLYKGPVTDLSGRLFLSVTAFQYACWSLDLQMCKLFRTYLPDLAAAQQLADWEKNYPEAHGIEVSWEPLIRAIALFGQAYQEYYDEEFRGTFPLFGQVPEAEEYLTKKIGGLQRQLPVHVINLYCQEKLFDTKNDFKDEKETLSRTRKLNIGRDWFDEIKGKERGQTLKLGVDWAVVRGPDEVGSRLVFGTFMLPPADSFWWKTDFFVLNNLYKARTRQFRLLKSELLLLLADKSLIKLS